MPELGEIKRDKNWVKYIWHGCVDCGRERWVQLVGGQPQSLRCRKCSPWHRSPDTYNRGKENPSWKGGRRKDKDGYILLRLQPDDFFYPMVGRGGYVLEHRLVMAKHLGRCLHTWEIVHHKNHIRDDNRKENLQLASDDKHKQISILEAKIARLQKQNKELKGRLKRYE